VIYEGTKDLKLQICPVYIMGTAVLLKLIMFTIEHYGIVVCDFIHGQMLIFLKNVLLCNQGRYGKWQRQFSRNFRSLPIRLTTRHHYAEECNLHAYRRENLKSHTVIIRVLLLLQSLIYVNAYMCSSSPLSKWIRGRFSSEYFGFPLPSPFQQCCIPTHSSITDAL
jgi:hypothetical protein